MPAPQFIKYSHRQLREHDLDPGHHAAVDLDDDVDTSLVKIVGSYTYDGEVPRTSVDLDITDLGVEHLTVRLNGKPIYHGDAQLEGVSAADVAATLRAAMKNADGSRSILHPPLIEDILTTLGL